MFCSKCGLQLADTIKICPRCRNVLAPTAQPIRPPQPTYQPPVYQQPVYQQPTYQRPVYQPPVYQQPTYQQPVAAQPVAEQPAVVPPVAEQPAAAPTVTVAEAPAVEPAAEPVAEVPAEPQPFVAAKQVNVPLGVLGSLLGALAGGLVWFLLGMFGIIAGIAGIIMVGLGLFLFKKFSGTENSILGVIVTVVMAILAIFLAEYMVIAYTLADIGLVPTFGAGLRYGPEMISMVPELSGAVWTDIIVGIVFGALGSVGMIVTEIKARKASK